jgi:hypothetical protein
VSALREKLTLPPLRHSLQFLIIVVLLFVSLFCGIENSHAGNPAFVAGSGYSPGVEGQALVWANGSVQYFTDQGNLSPIVRGAQADALVATAFSTWTSISAVALTASLGRHLAEDVTGSNIAASDGIVSDPADIMSVATGTPIGIVYDFDGTVTDALLGEGAGGSADCFTNAVYGEPDNFSAGGNIVHALVVINGVCATTNAQLPDIQYRLVRVLGRILGLGWSQANLNVLTRDPVPNSSDFAGFPVMHFSDPISCVPISACYPAPGTPKMDDIIALQRLYPANSNPQHTGRIHGSVYFTDATGIAVQPMQGVNVVARLMVSGEPSPQSVATSVSGFAFCGNAGNIIDGYVDASGLRYDRWGSSDPSLEGFFDLGPLPIPAGQTIAQYQLSVEALDPNWSLGMTSYGPTQVTPSGSFAPVVVTVTNGSNAERDILMLQDEIAAVHPGSGSTYAIPAALPQGGAWGSRISGYGSADFFQFQAQANRTASVVVTALDEAGVPTENKLLPVIGMWQLSDTSGNPAPASTPSAFNTISPATTRLDAQFGASDTFRVAVADMRGDGRPDYFYQANLLYSDTVTPSRLSLAGGVATLNGIGFRPGLQVIIGARNGNTLSASANQMQVTLPPGTKDGSATIQITDPVTGAFSQMIGALDYGARSSDLLLLVQGSEPATVVGSQAANPIRVRVVAADGVTPVSGATVAWSATNGLQFSACGGATACSVLSDEAGESSSMVTPKLTGASTITIALAPASYSPAQTRQTTVLGTSSGLDLVALAPMRWVGQGATIAVPLTVEALTLGVPIAKVTVNFTVTSGTTSLSATSATTNGSGLASVTAQISNQNGDVQVSACVARNNTPCQTFTLFSTPSSLWALETVSGSLQVVPAGRSFQPLVMRVTDGSPAANPVMGVNVSFDTTMSRATQNLGPDSGKNRQNDFTSGEEGSPILLGSSETIVATNQSGLAAVTPSVGNVGPCDVFITVNAGLLTADFHMESTGVIVPVQPVNLSLSSTRLLLGLRFAVQMPPLTSVAPALFAIPQGIQESPQPTDSQENASPESDSLAVDTHERADESIFRNDEAPVPCPAESLKDVEPPKEAKPAHEPLQRQSHSTPPVPKASPPALSGVDRKNGLKSKRNCQLLAAD